MISTNKFETSFLKLALEIDQHVDGYVDAYYGPEELKTAVSQSPPKPLTTLLDDIQRLRDNIPTEDSTRHDNFAATLRAMNCSVRMANGEQFAYLDEAQRIYDIQPKLVDESLFTDAHKALDSLYPGQGELHERMAVYRKEYALPKEKILPLTELIQTETRKRTAALWPLPEGEGVEVRLTEGQPWGAYNWFLGNGHSLIEINTDVPFSTLYLLSLFAHEGYPGHHTEAILKEKLLYKEKGYQEQSVMLLHSPAAVIAEGIAVTAVEIIFPNDSHYDWTVDVLLPAANLPGAGDLTAQSLRQISQASSALRYITGNAAILYHTGQHNKQQTIDYICTYGLVAPERAEKSFRFLSHPLFRSYIFTYTIGYDLLTAAAGDNKQALFGRLLTEQTLPSKLQNTP